MEFWGFFYLPNTISPSKSKSSFCYSLIKSLTFVQYWSCCWRSDFIFVIDWVKAHNQGLGWLCINAKFCSSLHFTINIKYIYSEMLNIFVYSSKYIWKNRKIVQGANSDLPELSSPGLSSSSTFFPARPSLSFLPLGRENIMIIQ